MNFVSISFFVSFPIILICYWVLPHRWKAPMLTIASYAFYIYWNHWVALVFFLTSMASYVSAIKMAAPDARKKKKWFYFAIFINLFSLFVFKYLGFFTWNISELLHMRGILNQAFVWHVLLPVGISFHTFQTMSYLFDVNAKRIEPERNGITFFLYVSYFPQLVAGPIERAGLLLPQLKEKHEFQWEYIAVGLQYMLLGYLKKVMMSDFVAPYVNQIYAYKKTVSGPEVAFATILFAFQIYGDFSGYSDMAVGCARMMGIRLTKNFDQPYLAKSMKDFWRRWHISLSRWFLVYVYIPLGGSRKGKLLYARNILLVFILSGFWHGAKWHFIVWGLLHGIAVLFETAISSKIRRKASLQKYKDKASAILTFLWVSVTWIYFRSDSLSQANLFFHKLLFGWSKEAVVSLWQHLNLNVEVLLHMILSVLCIFLIEKMPQWKFRKQIFLQGYMMFVLVMILCFSALILMKSPDNNAFIYFQF